MAFLYVSTASLLNTKTICDYMGGESRPKITSILDHKEDLNDTSPWW